MRTKDTGHSTWYPKATSMPDSILPPLRCLWQKSSPSEHILIHTRTLSQFKLPETLDYMGAMPRTGRREKVTPADPLVGTICCHPLPSSSCSRRVSWDMAGTPFRQLMGVSAPGNRKLAVRLGRVSNRVFTFGFSMITWALLELTTSFRSLSRRFLRSGEFV